LGSGLQKSHLGSTIDADPVCFDQRSMTQLAAADRPIGRSIPPVSRASPLEAHVRRRVGGPHSACVRAVFGWERPIRGTGGANRIASESRPAGSFACTATSPTRTGNESLGNPREQDWFEEEA